MRINAGLDCLLAEINRQEEETLHYKRVVHPIIFYLVESGKCKNIKEAIKHYKKASQEVYDEWVKDNKVSKHTENPLS